MNCIREARKNNNLTIKELAWELNTVSGVIVKWETGQRFPRPKELKKLSQFLKLPIERILDDYLLANKGE